MLSKRERWIAIGALIILVLLPADRFILTPVLDKLAAVADRRQQLVGQLDEAQNLFDRRRLMEKKWRLFSSQGLETESQAESRVLHAVGQWAQDSRLTMTSVKPQRLATEGTDLQEMTVSVAGTGSLQAAARFLWNVEHAAIPVKIKDLQLGSANDTGSEMSLQVRLSTLYIGAGEGKVSNENNEGV
ncbi:MAG: hypothetical protein IH624_06890 [Phycisphaerae bacterium]|nr:hypothetical protein [Phycisphaerae bacterium]